MKGKAGTGIACTSTAELANAPLQINLGPCRTPAPLPEPQLRRRRVVVGQEINRESCGCEPGGGHDLHEIWARRPRE